MLGLTKILILLCVVIISAESASVLFTDTFDGGLGNWVQTATVGTTTSPRLGSGGLAAKLQLRGMLEKQISTVGYDTITVSWNIAASSLEGGISNDRCHFEYSADKGFSYISVVSLLDGQDTSSFFSGSLVLPSNASNNPNFMIRYRDSGDATGDYCYAETTTVSGTSNSFSSPPAPVMQTSFQDLSGSGIVTRTLLTYAQLTGSGQIAGPVDLSAFALPSNAAQPTNWLHGSIESLNERTVGSYTAIRDDYKYAGNAERTHIPHIFSDIFSHGSHVIPAVRMLSGVSHPFWELILQGGRVWNENGDNGYSRVALPFAITQKNSNCIHNGILMFVFKTAANGVDIQSISRGYYQISQETCVYYKVNMWGTIDLSAITHGIQGGAASLRTGYELEISNRLPVKPLSDLAVDFPGTNVANIGIEQNTGHMTFQGVEIDGTIYRGTFATRNGNYPYPEALIAPSYSTVKTWGELVGVLAFDLEFPSYGILDKFVTDLIPSASSAVWGNVKVRHLIDMSSGVYSLAGFEADEGSTAMSNGFFLRETHSQRINYCLTYGSKKSAPGVTWIYTTCQAYIVATMMRVAVDSQLPTIGSWNGYLVDRIYSKLNLSSVTRHRKITYESLTGSGILFQEIGGYGEYMVLDDMAKIGRFINNNEGKINGVQKLTYSQLKAALQRDTIDKGFSVSGLTYPAYYNNFVWATDVYAGIYNSQTVNCGGEYEPYMSGYGGITIALLKSKINYLVVSDDEIYAIATSIKELASKVRLPCATTYSP